MGYELTTKLKRKNSCGCEQKVFQQLRLPCCSVILAHSNGAATGQPRRRLEMTDTSSSVDVNTHISRDLSEFCPPIIIFSGVAGSTGSPFGISFWIFGGFFGIFFVAGIGRILIFRNFRRKFIFETTPEL
jgi:hypothetical protein